MGLLTEKLEEYEKIARRVQNHANYILSELAKDWYDYLAQIMEHQHSGGVWLTCVECGSNFFLTEGEISFYRKNKLHTPKRCSQCRPKRDLLYVSNGGVPYRNAIVDNMFLHTECVGTGEKVWRSQANQAMRESLRYVSEVPFDEKNNAQREWVFKKIKEKIVDIEKEHSNASSLKDNWCFFRLAACYLAMHDMENYDKYLRKYIDFPHSLEKSLIEQEHEKSKRTVCKQQNYDATNKKPANLISYFQSKGLTVIDKRPSGGCLWVVGSEDKIKNYTDEACKMFNISGTFCGGGKATNYKRSWYTNCKG